MTSATYQRVWNQRVRQHYQQLQAAPVVHVKDKYTCARCGQHIADKVVYRVKKQRHHRACHPAFASVAKNPVFAGVRP